MDEKISTGSTSSAGGTAVAAPVRPSVRKPMRLGKGLSSLYAPAAACKPEAMARPETDEFPALADRQRRSDDVATPQAAEMKADADETPAAAALSALAEMGAASAPAAPVAAIAPTGPAAKPVATDDPRNLYDAERLHRALTRMEAVCSLVIDAERLQQRHVRRALTVAWAAAAVLAVVCGVVLWSAGSGNAWNKAQLERAQAATAAASDELVDVRAQMAELRGQSQRLAGELDTLRSALSKANGVIDELMTVRPAVSVEGQE